MRRDTGFTGHDAQGDFSRARRRQAVSRLAARLRREPEDVHVILPFDEVVGALGRAGERRLGTRVIGLDSIVGTVDRSREFDRGFRPTSRRARQRWERIARAMRRGESMPPVDVFRVGEMHFVEDGHHRVSVARELGLETIEARVTEIVTKVGAESGMRVSELARKGHERLFFERVPLPAELRPRIELADQAQYARLAEAVEAWGFRTMQARGEPMSREQVAAEWFTAEFEPVVEMLREAGLGGAGSAAADYMRVSAQRYMLLQTHEWDDDVVERLRQALGE